jgi:hypothetical protein
MVWAKLSDVMTQVVLTLFSKRFVLESVHTGSPRESEDSIRRKQDMP